jgi:hypothetical protein
MENKMENENKRYTFGGFTFGSQKLFNLTISVRNYAGFGTSNTVEMGIELSPEEIQELITVLITRNAKEDN